MSHPQAPFHHLAKVISVPVYDDVTALVGNTPLVRINRLSAGAGATVAAKLEFQNPGGSVKDRIGVSIIDAAERSGQLKPGGTIVEATSGNTGMRWRWWVRPVDTTWSSPCRRR
jgi:threonine synthase